LIIKELFLGSWRNIEQTSLKIPEGITVIYGKNGTGKTNLLEAIFSLINFRSFRTNSLAEAIRWGQTKAYLSAALEVAGIRRKLEIQIEKSNKSARLDEKEVRRDCDSLNAFSVVVFSPDDLKLVKSSPSERRKYLDRIVFSGNRNYAKIAVDYNRSIKARNNLLRMGKSEHLIKSYDEILSRTGAKIIKERREVAQKLQTNGALTFCDLHSDLDLKLSYMTKLGEVIEEGKEFDFIHTALERTFEKDLKLGFTSVGPHHDDLRIRLKGVAADQHASQGQIRSIVLALKIAELKIVSEKTQEKPIFLLDDVASELDEEKRTKLIDVVQILGCQSIITVTEREQVPSSVKRTDWVAIDGEIQTAKNSAKS
jgi:DNA replication and repair protein RecF